MKRWHRGVAFIGEGIVCQFSRPLGHLASLVRVISQAELVKVVRGAPWSGPLQSGKGQLFQHNWTQRVFYKGDCVLRVRVPAPGLYLVLDVTCFKATSSTNNHSVTDVCPCGNPSFMFLRLPLAIVVYLWLHQLLALHPRHCLYHGRSLCFHSIFQGS